MKNHEHDGICPRCGETLSLTTEWGWIDGDTCTAVLCCAECRTETRYTDAAVVMAHGSDEKSAIDALDDSEFYRQMAAAMAMAGGG